ncbi:MAG: YceI family protein [Mycobacterium sp.]
MSTATELLQNPEAIGIWALDHNRSSFVFRNKTMWGLANVKGRFGAFSGEGHVEAGGKVSGRIDIKAASLSTGIKRRDDHLRSADFFDAEDYPEITVTVHGVDPVEGGELNVRADLSIRGNTVALPMRARGEVLDDGAVRLSTTTTVEREQLGVSGNMVGMLGKTTTLSADAVFHRAGG